MTDKTSYKQERVSDDGERLIYVFTTMAVDESEHWNYSTLPPALAGVPICGLYLVRPGERVHICSMTPNSRADFLRNVAVLHGGDPDYEAKQEAESDIAYENEEATSYFGYIGEAPNGDAFGKPFTIEIALRDIDYERVLADLESQRDEYKRRGSYWGDDAATYEVAIAALAADAPPLDDLNDAETRDPLAIAIWRQGAEQAWEAALESESSDPSSEPELCGPEGYRRARLKREARDAEPLPLMPAAPVQLPPGV